jgi:hypothetical protein
VAVVTVVPDGVKVEAVDHLVMALDDLSQAMWDTYVHPASQFGDLLPCRAQGAGEREADSWLLVEANAVGEG